MRNSQSPSVYSIYNNSLPFYLDRADISMVADEVSAFASGFIPSLLQGNLIFQFDSSSLSAEKMRHLYFESRNHAKVSGAKTFGFGYPHLIDTFEGELMVAPLFIWQLHLEPAQTKVDAWVLKFDQESHLLPNYKVIGYLKEKFDIDLKEKFLSLIADNKVRPEDLRRFCQELADRFHFETITGENNLVASPGIDEIGAFTEKGAIHWSGVFGIYPPQHTNWKASDKKPEDVFVPGAKSIESDAFVFPFLAADPEQVTSVEVINKNSMSVVEGIDALGKTQALLNLLFMALSQGKKCLVVSERAPALKKTQDLLARSGLHQLHFLLTDALNDKTPLLELLRVAAKGTGNAPPFDQNDFQFKKNKFLREQQRMVEAYQAVKEKVFGDYNWTETVGLFLKNNKVEGKELLGSHLNSKKFKFDKDEHAALKKGVASSFPLFQKVKTLKHPLSNLNDKVFQQVTADSGRAYVEEQLDVFTKKSSELLHQYINGIDAYRASLKNHYQNYVNEIEGLFSEVNDKILGYSDKFGADFKNASIGSFRIPFLFSAKKKKVVGAQNDCAKSYQNLKKAFEANPYFEFQFGAAKNGMDMPGVSENLKSFREAFVFWKSKLDGNIQEEVNRLNSKTAHPSLGVKEEITQLEYSLDLFLEELNEAGIYQKPFENKMLTVPQRQKYLESIIEQLESTQLNLRDFPIFYQWQSNWLEMGPLGQKVVKALVKVKPKNWLAAFESWYFNSLLEGRRTDKLADNPGLVTNYAQAWHGLKPLMLPRILKHWEGQQAKWTKELRRKNKNKYKLIFEKGGHKKAAALSLHEVLEGGFEAVTSFLPVLFVTPHVALNVVPKGFLFDYVIYEEANRFTVETATDIAGLGRQAAIFGSNDNYGNETSLLQYALENGVPSVAITNRYEAPVHRSQMASSDEHAFHFANKYFVDNLEGRFHELEGTNDVEAQHIIRLLNQVKQTPQRIYPTVGIVAFTIEQRDLISAYLLKLKQQNVVGSEKIRQLERNGMGVYFVEEIFGQQFDILILSCTYGMVNLKGKLTKKVMFLNNPEGVSHMHMLINKPVQQLHLVHSFPEKQVEAFKGKKWEEGTWLLAHFITLAEATANGNEAQAKACMEAIGKNTPRAAGKFVLANEIADALTAYVDPNRLVVNTRRGDILLPLLVKPANVSQPETVVHPDGFFADTEYTSGIWEQYHRNNLQQTKVNYLPVWSVNWLENPSLEARKLAGQIIRFDGQFKDGGLSEKEKEINEK
ncbi:MAG TPA: hypothetical protein ENJ95_10345 [Bacteroidetes bacterium]|nr:hypothetical protein [Bacteroidota bacterium]